MEIITGKQTKGQKVVIYGLEGVGKTTLAASFPKALFIDTEGSTTHMDVNRTPRPTSWAMLTGQIAELRRNTQGFQTLIIDTADWAERMCAEALLAQHNQDGLEGFGYGKGYRYMAEWFGKFLDSLTDLVERTGMHVVLTAHAATRKIELPEETGAYDKWEMKLSKQVAPLVKEWADMVLFCAYKTYVVEDAKTKTKKAQGGQRVMYATHSVVWDAKNRHDLPEEIEMGDKPGEAFRQIAHCFPVIAAAPPATTPTPTATTEPKPEQKAESKPVPADASSPLWQLNDLMAQAGVTWPQLMKTIAKRGHYPENTPPENLDPKFISGMLIAQWDRVLVAINQTNGVAANA